MDTGSVIHSEQTNKIRQHNTFTFELETSPKRLVTISSDFDSGNLMSAVEEGPYTYRLRPCPDIEGVTKSKNWFYFKVRGFPATQRVSFIIEQMTCLYSFGRSFAGKKEQNYKPCRKVGGGCWEKFDEGVTVEKTDVDDTRLRFWHTFQKQGEEAAFAFTYPYEFGRYLTYLNQIEESHNSADEVFFQREILTWSVEKRPIYLLNISSSQGRKATPTRNKKPVVLVTSRVHPGEVPSSYAAEGVIEFLMSKRDLRAHILRKLFTFKIIPMLNPDGVYRGHYRMDSLGQNLNRYYSKECDKDTQPAIHAVKSLLQALSKEERLGFYFDLHAHAGRKGTFIYGNSLTDFVQLVEANVFCKLMATNSYFFQNNCSNFSQKQMTHKDRFEELSKDNCGRVFVYKTSGIIHSFTVELGYHFTNNFHTVQASNLNFEVGKYNYVQCNKSTLKVFSPQAFMEIGESLMISILDSLGFNPYTKVLNSQYQNLGSLRRATAFAIFQSDQKFRLYDMKTYSKVKNMNSTINLNYYNKFDRLFRFNETYKKLFQNPEWSYCLENASKEEETLKQVQIEMMENNSIIKKELEAEVQSKDGPEHGSKSDNSSESSDLDGELEQPSVRANPVEKTKDSSIRGLLQITQIKYGSATIVKNQLPSLQTRGTTPTIRNLTAQKDKKPTPVSFQIQSLKLKIKKEFARQIKNELIKEQNNKPTFNSNKFVRREHKSMNVKRVKETIKFTGPVLTKDVSPLSLKTLEPPRMSQIYLPFLSK